MTNNTFDNFYYNKTYNIYHYSQLCGNNTKKYRFDANVVMDSLYNIDSKYVYSNREDVKIISYNEEDSILTVSVYLDGEIKIESFKYDDDRDHITEIKKWDYTYDDIKDEYIGFESLNYSFYAINGKIYDEIIKWWYDVTDRSYEGMNKNDFSIIRFIKTNNGYILFHNRKQDTYFKIKIFRADETETGLYVKQITKSIYSKKLRIQPYFISINKLKKYIKAIESLKEVYPDNNIIKIEDIVFEVYLNKKEKIPFTYDKTGSLHCTYINPKFSRVNNRQ